MIFFSAPSGTGGTTASLAKQFLITTAGELQAVNLPTSAGGGGIYVCMPK
jgi:hypothetical protein